MDALKLANDIQMSLNSLTSLTIQATEENMRHLLGAMSTLAAVRDALTRDSNADSGQKRIVGGL